MVINTLDGKNIVMRIDFGGSAFGRKIKILPIDIPTYSSIFLIIS